MSGQQLPVIVPVRQQINLAIRGLFAEKERGCFKALERLGDRITGAAGPFSVAFAVILISLGTSHVAAHLWPNMRSHAPNLRMYHLYAITAPPGLADDPPVTDPAKSSAQSSLFWASKKAPRRGELASEQ
ncbi:hypothetical protein B0H14DRAFT_3473657 [Mycena olivaceomarginata]|nr:hypothetical protein B0H14DRAFT_3473657 [Mycena olivaceomarginata]